MTQFAHRSSALELMDQLLAGGADDASPHDLETTFTELDRINAWLGGYAVSVRGIASLLPPGCRRFSLLDVGSGGGELLDHLTQWAERRGVETELTGLDHSASTVARARSRPGRRRSDGITFICDNLLTFDPGRRYDIVHSALTLHHLDDASAVTALTRMAGLARWGVVINDLHRHPIAYGSIALLTRLCSRSRLIRHDAPLSVLRAFTRRELRALVEQTGLRAVSLRWRWAFRWELVIQR